MQAEVQTAAEDTSPVVATFANVAVGTRLTAGSHTLSVSAKDGLRVELYDEADPRRTISFYAPEFDARAFEVIPPPPQKIKK